MNNGSIKMDSYLRRFVRYSGYLFPKQTKVVVAVSGGADSLGLLRMLVDSELVSRNHLLVAHFDHKTRPESSEDADFVANHAHQLGVECVIKQWHATPLGLGSLEERERVARYAFLEHSAIQFKADRVATGHHQNDQAETVIERLLRGSGVRGLSAMRPLRPLAKNPALFLIRPLLYLTRYDIQTWLRQQKIPWLEDSSNQNLSFRRNQIRMEALPTLEKIADGGLSQRLAATAERMFRANEALEWMREQLWEQWQPMEESGVLSLDHLKLSTLPDEMLFRCLIHCHHKLTGNHYQPGSKAVAGFIYLMRSRRRHWHMNMRGLRVERRLKRVYFQKPNVKTKKSFSSPI